MEDSIPDADVLSAAALNYAGCLPPATVYRRMLEYKQILAYGLLDDLAPEMDSPTTSGSRATVRLIRVNGAWVIRKYYYPKEDPEANVSFLKDIKNEMLLSYFVNSLVMSYISPHYPLTYSTYETPSLLAVHMEKSTMDLAEHLNSHARPEMTVYASYCLLFQLFHAIVGLHYHGLTHNDTKFENFLVDPIDASTVYRYTVAGHKTDLCMTCGFTVRLTDFNLAAGNMIGVNVDNYPLLFSTLEQKTELPRNITTEWIDRYGVQPLYMKYEGQVIAPFAIDYLYVLIEFIRFRGKIHRPVESTVIAELYRRLFRDGGLKTPRDSVQFFNEFQNMPEFTMKQIPFNSRPCVEEFSM